MNLSSCTSPEIALYFTMTKYDENFFSSVYEVVALIPKGRVSSYGAIAEYLGLKSGARMVGWAMNAAHCNPDVPAHRVVNRNGLLTGKHHFAEEDTMERLLSEEGHSVKKDKIENFDKVFWHPSKELL